MDRASPPNDPGPGQKVPLFRAEHVGSLLRPAKLKEAYGEFNAGRRSLAGFHQVQDRCVRDAVALQERIGFQAITDGEFRRASYWSHFTDKVRGLTVKPAVFRFRDQEGKEEEFLAPHVAGKLTRDQSISGHELDFLKSTTSRTPKLTLPSPSTLHFWRGRQGVEREAYEELDELFLDLARIYREEIADLAARGARYLQLDEVPLVMLCDPGVREWIATQGEDPDGMIRRYSDLINAALKDRPRGLRVALHMCRGNFKGKWLSQGGYEAIAEGLFHSLEVDSYFLEYDTERAGSFRPLQSMPKQRSVVLGLVSTKTPKLESRDYLRRRIDEASRFVPLEDLALSPQCGFASTVGGNPVEWEDQVKKLERVVEVSRLVWGET